jgi:hypothetical protein
MYSVFSTDSIDSHAEVVDSVARFAQSLSSARGRSLTHLLEKIAQERWEGVPISYEMRQDGAVHISYIGLSGTGQTEAAALLDLDRRVRAGQVEYTLALTDTPCSSAERVWR